jgi:hypothetical protein
MTKKKGHAVTVSSTTTVVASSVDAASVTVVAHGVGGAAAGVTHGVTSSVDGIRLCIECAEWKSLETFDKHSKICRACSEARG